MPDGVVSGRETAATLCDRLYIVSAQVPSSILIPDYATSGEPTSEISSRHQNSGEAACRRLSS